MSSYSTVGPAVAASAARRGEYRGQPPSRKLAFAPTDYRSRSIVERVVGCPTYLRRIAFTAEKRAMRHAGLVTLALIVRTAAASSDMT